MFHLSFDNGIEPDFARGSAEVNLGGDPLAVFGEAGEATGGAVKSPEEAQDRLVEGLIGKGYRFAGQSDEHGDGGELSRSRGR